MKYWEKISGSSDAGLYIALLCGLGLTVIHMILPVNLYRDSANVYAFMVRSLAEGNYRDAIHPAIPSLNVLLSYPFTLAGFAPERALLLVSCLFYLGTAVFLYFLLKEFIPEKLAGLGVLLYILIMSHFL